MWEGIKIMILALIFTLILILGIIFIGNYFSWKSYKNLTHSKIAYWNYVCLQPQYKDNQIHK